MSNYPTDSSVESVTIKVFRTSTTVKGGRRFSFAALVVSGDRNGSVGIGYQKSAQVPMAVEKAQREAGRKLRPFPLQGRTIPHQVEGRFGATIVRIIPAAPGTGVIAGATVRNILDMFGVQDCLTKVYGNSNPRNLSKAVFDALNQLRTRAKVQQLRGVEIPETAVEVAIQRGAASSPRRSTGEKMAAPVNTVGDDRRGGRGGRGGPRGGFGGGGGRG
ncbi:MAG: 30S ribosomal protein S5, partial [Planctomycetota bacterium]|nr:30S ribosomal protein S5 [Planctomycetota bacterium]